MASYVRPMTRVYQEYANTSNSTLSADLPACIVGPCYHVIDSVKDTAKAYAGSLIHDLGETADLFDTTGTKKKWLSIPSLITGSVVDTLSCVINLTNASVRYATFVPVTLSSENRSILGLPTENPEDENWNIPEKLSGGTDSSAYILPKVAKAGDAVEVYYRPIYSVPVSSEDSGSGQAVTYSYGDWRSLCARTVRSVSTAGSGTLALNASLESTTALEQTLASEIESLPGVEYSYAGIEFSICVYRHFDSITIPVSSLSATGTAEDGYASVSDFGTDGESFKFGTVHCRIVTGVSYEGDNDTKVYHGALCRVSRANIYLGYRALRQDLTTGTLYTLAEVEGRLGTVCPENPLAYGMSIAMANSSGQGIIYAAVPSDDLAGYTAAKDRISNINPCYGIVPLTRDTAVLTMFKQHALAMSAPEVGMWRIVIGTTPLARNTNVYRGICTVDTDKRLLTAHEDPAYDVPAFISNDVVPGDIVTFSYAGKSYVYEVHETLSDNQMTIVQDMSYEQLPSGLDSVEFTITHSMDKTEQAKNIANVSRSYGSRRYINVWPDICRIDGVEQPSYYLACAVAAGCGALPSQYGFTRLSLAGVGGLRHANDYFNQEQLDLIAEGGTFIFVCDAEGAAPYVRHELTTDRSTIEFQELMFTKNFDYISYVAKAALDPFIGSWNITEATLGAIRTALKATFNNLMLDTREKIGAPILGYELVSVSQLESSRDRVEAYVNVECPYPLNTIGLHIVSQ